MRYRLKPRRNKCLWVIRIVLVFVLVLFLSALAALFIIDRVVTPQIYETYGSELTSNIRYFTLPDEETRIAFRQSGSGEDVIVLVHGFLGSSNDFSGIITNLSEQHTVIAVDLIGFGLSDKDLDLDYSKKNMAEMVRKLVLSQDIDHYTVLGHSMGGEIALHLAHAYPNEVMQAILLNSAGMVDIQQGLSPSFPPFLVDSVFKNYGLQYLFFRKIMVNRSLASLDTFNRFYYFNNQIPGKTLVRMVEDNDSGQLAGKLNEVSQPVLLIWGRQDHVIPVEQGYELDQVLPDSRLVILDDCGHLTFLENPDAVLKAVQDFLNETNPSLSD
jgi:pimeloyl-ACP methyl ester carboxylesterase